MRTLVILIVAGMSVVVIGTLFPNALMPILIGYGVVLVVGLFHTTVRELFGYVVTPIHFIGDARRYLSERIERLQGWSHGVRQDSGLERNNALLNRLTGTFLHFIVFAMFVFSEYYLVTESLGLMSRGEASFLPLPQWINPELIIAFCIVGGGVFWGTVFTDLAGKTDFAPWRRLSPAHQEFMKKAAITCMILFVAVAGLLAVYRAVGMVEWMQAVSVEDLPLEGADDLMPEAIDEAEAAGQVQSDKMGQLLTLIMHPVLAGLIIISSIASGWVLQTIPWFARFAGVKLVELVLWLMVAALEIVRRLLQVAGSILLALVDLMIRVSILLAAPVAGAIHPSYIDLQSPKDRQGGDSSEEAATLQPEESSSVVKDEPTEDSDQQQDAPEPIVDLSDDEPRPNRNWSPYRRN